MRSTRIFCALVSAALKKKQRKRMPLQRQPMERICTVNTTRLLQQSLCSGITYLVGIKVCKPHGCRDVRTSTSSHSCILPPAAQVTAASVSTKHIWKSNWAAVGPKTCTNSPCSFACSEFCHDSQHDERKEDLHVMHGTSGGNDKLLPYLYTPAQDWCCTGGALPRAA